MPITRPTSKTDKTIIKVIKQKEFSFSQLHTRTSTSTKMLKQYYSHGKATAVSDGGWRTAGEFSWRVSDDRQRRTGGSHREDDEFEKLSVLQYYNSVILRGG